jgi:hypothetical protein
MTHPIYSQTTLELLSTSQVKDIAKSIGAIPDGDKRVKQTWISAVIDHQKVFTPAKFKAMEAHVETVMNRLEPIPTDETDNYVPTPSTHADDVSFATAMGLTYDDVFGEPLGATEWEETTPTLEPNTQVLEPNPQVSEQTAPMRGASIVALVVVLIFGMAFLVVKTGFTAFAWVLAALSPLALGLWRYLVPDPKHQDSTGSRSSIPLNQVLIN